MSATSSASSSRRELTHREVVRLLEYDPCRGVLLWRASGEVAGCLSDGGYIRIKLNGKSYQAHRLAWFWVTGHWPQGVVHHKNNVRHNNTFWNLMDVPVAVNNLTANRLPARKGRAAALYQ